MNDHKTMEFKSGKTYVLTAMQHSWVNSAYSNINAMYVGSYMHYGVVSHRFIHVVPESSYVDFVAMWPHIGANFPLKTNTDGDPQGAEVMYTDIHEYKFIRGVVAVACESSQTS